MNEKMIDRELCVHVYNKTQHFGTASHVVKTLPYPPVASVVAW
jgi:hypothetical protein